MSRLYQAGGHGLMGGFARATPAHPLDLLDYTWSGSTGWSRDGRDIVAVNGDNYFTPEGLVLTSGATYRVIAQIERTGGQVQISLGLLANQIVVDTGASANIDQNVVEAGSDNVLYLSGGGFFNGRITALTIQRI